MKLPYEDIEVSFLTVITSYHNLTFAAYQRKISGLSTVNPEIALGLNPFLFVLSQINCLVLLSFLMVASGKRSIIDTSPVSVGQITEQLQEVPKTPSIITVYHISI